MSDSMFSITGKEETAVSYVWTSELGFIYQDDQGTAALLATNIAQSARRRGASLIRVPQGHETTDFLSHFEGYECRIDQLLNVFSDMLRLEKESVILGKMKTKTRTAFIIFVVMENSNALLYKLDR